VEDPPHQCEKNNKKKKNTQGGQHDLHEKSSNANARRATPMQEGNINNVRRK
jgi:hypothetical protein